MGILEKNFRVSIANEDELNQIERAFKAAGYRWHIGDASRQYAFENKVVALLNDGAVCGTNGTGATPIPFREGMALLGAPVEDVKPAFKVGDKVRIVREADDGWLGWLPAMTDVISQCGTVTRVGCCGRNHIRVKTDACEYYYLAESLELIAEPEPRTEIKVVPSAALTWSNEDRAHLHRLMQVTASPMFSKRNKPMSETKAPTTIERRIALATGRILWKGAWPVRKLVRGVTKGAVSAFYTALFGAFCYGGYELYQFLQAVKITLPE